MQPPGQDNSAICLQADILIVLGKLEWCRVRPSEGTNHLAMSAVDDEAIA